LELIWAWADWPSLKWPCVHIKVIDLLELISSDTKFAPIEVQMKDVLLSDYGTNVNVSAFLYPWSESISNLYKNSPLISYFL
jgi:hypothetical protein